MVRLQKYMADCGVASRRACEEIIKEGRVKVNGDTIIEMGFKVSADDVVTVDGKQIEISYEKKYYVMNKPRFIISSVSDPKKRKTVIDILPSELSKYRLFPVGRLDYDTKGVLLFTNDGEFMNLLVGPKSHTEKEYLARVKGAFRKEDLNKLTRPIKVKGEKGEYITRGAKAYIASYDRVNNSTSVGIIIEEGKYHQVKDMFKSIGFEVTRLSRIRFGNITLDNLGEGMVRPLTIHEVKVLIGEAKSKKN